MSQDVHLLHVCIKKFNIKGEVAQMRKFMSAILTLCIAAGLLTAMTACSGEDGAAAAGSDNAGMENNGGGTVNAEQIEENGFAPGDGDPLDEVAGYYVLDEYRVIGIHTNGTYTDDEGRFNGIVMLDGDTLYFGTQNSWDSPEDDPGGTLFITAYVPSGDGYAENGDGGSTLIPVDAACPVMDAFENPSIPGYYLEETENGYQWTVIAEDATWYRVDESGAKTAEGRVWAEDYDDIYLLSGKNLPLHYVQEDYGALLFEDEASQMLMSVAAIPGKTEMNPSLAGHYFYDERDICVNLTADGRWTAYNYRSEIIAEATAVPDTMTPSLLVTDTDGNAVRWYLGDAIGEAGRMVTDEGVVITRHLVTEDPIADAFLKPFFTPARDAILTVNADKTYTKTTLDGETLDTGKVQTLGEMEDPYGQDCDAVLLLSDKGGYPTVLTDEYEIYDRSCKESGHIGLFGIEYSDYDAAVNFMEQYEALQLFPEKRMLCSDDGSYSVLILGCEYGMIPAASGNDNQVTRLEHKRMHITDETVIPAWRLTFETFWDIHPEGDAYALQIGSDKDRDTVVLKPADTRTSVDANGMLRGTGVWYDASADQYTMLYGVQVDNSVNRLVAEYRIVSADNTVLDTGKVTFGLTPEYSLVNAAGEVIRTMTLHEDGTMTDDSGIVYAETYDRVLGEIW